MRNKTDWMLLIGLALAGSGLGGLVAFERIIDGYGSAVLSGLLLGVGLAIAIYGVVANFTRFK